MELTNEFTVAVPVEQAWAVLTDVERIAPCMPGAQLQEVDGDEYRGVVKVKVGPVTAEYRGKAMFLERDPERRRAVLRAEGRETRGQGNASATISANLAPSGEGTTVTVVTDLSITGRVAQFGRGVLADVSNKLLGQFVDCLERTVIGDGVSAAPPSGAAAPGGAGTDEPKESPGNPGADQSASPQEGAAATADGGAQAAPSIGAGSDGDRTAAGASRVPDGEPEPVNLLRVVGPAILKRLIPPLLVGAVLYMLRRRRRRRAG
jgi:uncharacterized protein